MTRSERHDAQGDLYRSGTRPESPRPVWSEWRGVAGHASPHSRERHALSEPVGDRPLLRWCSLGLALDLHAALARTSGAPSERCRAVWGAVSEPTRDVLRTHRDEALLWAGEGE